MSPFISYLTLPRQGVPLTLPDFLPLVGGVVLALVLALFLRETGTVELGPLTQDGGKPSTRTLAPA